MPDKHRRFAELVAQGVAAGRAYEQVGYKARDRVADSNASRLLTNANVSAYVEQLRAEANEKARKEAVLSLQEVQEFLARVVRTPLGNVSEDSELCQEHSRTDGLNSSSVKYKMPCKLKAAELAMKLSGEFKEKVEVGISDTLMEFIGGIRKGE